MYIKDIRSVSFENVSSTTYEITIEDANAGESELVRFLEHFTECYQLTINMVKLKNLPPIFHRIDKLRDLRIISEQLTEIPDDLVPPSVNYFQFRGKELKSLPSFLCKGGIDHFYIEVDQLHRQDWTSTETEGSKIYNIHLAIGNLETLPSFLKSLTHLRSLTVSSDSLKEIPDSFFDPIQLHYLSITGRYLKRIPDLHLQTQLSQLSIKSNEPLHLQKWKLPSQLARLFLSGSELILPSLQQIPAVNQLHFKGVRGTIGDDIGQCIMLQDLSCEHSQLEGISSEISRCQQLRSVRISESLTSFPKALLKITSLENLQLYSNTIPSLNEDWSALVNLKDLSLRRNKTVIDQLNFISDLPKLNTISLEGNTIANRYVWINKKKIPLVYEEGFFSNCKPNFKEVLAFGASLAKISSDEVFKHEFFDHFWKTGELLAFATATPQRLTHALNIAYTPLKNQLHNYLADFIKARHGSASLNESAVVYVEGKTIEPLTKIKEAVTTLGARYSTTLSDSVTHIILGKNPSNAAVFIGEKYLYLYEGDIFDQLSIHQPKFLVAQVEQGNTQILNGVTDLLLSPEAVNATIGLQMLQNGGVPNEILDIVLMLAKSNPDSAVRAEAKKILNLQAPVEWRQLIDDKQLFKNLNEEVKEQDIFHKLKSIEKEAGFDSAVLLSLALYRRYKKALRFMLLTTKGTDEQRKKMYGLLMQGEELDFATGLGFKNWKGHDPASMTLYTHKIKFPFPVDVLKWHRVTAINFHNCKFAAIPKEITSFTELKKLDLSCNFLIKIPNHMEKLTQLEELDLSSNNFKEFPMNLIKFKKLRKVDLRYSRIEYSIVPLVVPDEIKEAMPACEILV